MKDHAADEILGSYEHFDEDKRLADPYGVLQRRHTEEILRRYLPPAPADVLDVGGATGPYAFWLADLGYAVHLVDLVPRHVDLARQRNDRVHPLRSCVVADARALPFPDGSADAVILHGPLYHLAARADRDRVWAEARRLLRPRGLVFGFAISRHAGLVYGLSQNLVFDDAYYSVIEHEVSTGVRDNNPPRIRSMLKAYFHLPDELEAELRVHGFAVEQTLGVAGPGWNTPDAAAAVADPAKLDRLLAIARLVERQPLLSQGLVTIGCRPA
ncbi:class I SAM-dependent methyltransferase [Opitutus sp. ER46]|uniref:class I SAM-dependent methyltransferase n=1 Tax=Opitutus sp. ER46 TaxID=2161864 RepID=UPI000D2F5AA2|nr:class I SAM-dependent methyltransferase [Opitutus sp. ER46]PTX92693.1 class I SAM-dependent methyltransferase [Opitutus sp. ER46]